MPHDPSWSSLTFGFQYGAIKSTGREKYDVVFYEFQFQYGAIKSASGFAGWTPVLKFQFQYGAIKSVTHLSDLYKCIISIPVWCD